MKLDFRQRHQRRAKDRHGLDSASENAVPTMVSRDHQGQADRLGLGRHDVLIHTSPTGGSKIVL